MLDTLNVTIGGEDHEVFASYGLMNSLSRIIGDVDQVTNVLLNPEFRDQVLLAVLSPRTKTGKITSKIELDDLELTSELAREILEWAADRFLNFTLPLANSAVTKMMEVKPQIEKMAKSMSS